MADNPGSSGVRSTLRSSKLGRPCLAVAGGTSRRVAAVTAHFPLSALFLNAATLRPVGLNESVVSDASRIATTKSISEADCLAPANAAALEATVRIATCLLRLRH